MEVLEDDTNLGFVLYDSSVLFFKVDEEDGEISLVRATDSERPASLCRKRLFLNIKTHRE